jgi:hypothetical protein
LLKSRRSSCRLDEGAVAPKPPHYAPKAKASSTCLVAAFQLELLDYKPKLKEFSGQKIPEEFTKGERFAFIKGDAKILGPLQEFKQ